MVVGHERRQSEVDDLAAAYVRRMVWRSEARWHPQSINTQRVDGLGHLRQCLAGGRGCILSFVHHGDWEGAIPSIARHGFSVRVLGDTEFFDPGAPEWIRQMKRAIESIGDAAVVDVAGGSAVVRDLLRRGCVMAIALDVPGHTPTRFLRQDLVLSSGGTRIAMDLKVPVVVLTSRRDAGHRRGRSRVVLQPPLIPDDFKSAEQLREAVIELQERAILAWPEAVDKPSRLIDSRKIRRPTEYRGSP
jgi:lauroyl/myristoyl acyltransferase